MNYQQKYLKYKNKYLELKNNNLHGGEITITFQNPIDKPYEDFIHNHTTFCYIDINYEIKGMRDTNSISVNIEIPDTNEIRSDMCIYKMINYAELTEFEQKNINQTDNRILYIEMKEPATRGCEKINTKITPTHKIFNCSKKVNNTTYNLCIISDLNSLDDNNKRTTKDNGAPGIFLLNITNTTMNIEFNGTIIIGQNKNIVINNIDNHKLPEPMIITNNILNLFIIQPFNFQKAYDNLKQTNNYCPQSSILYKYIYNFMYTGIYFRHTNIIDILSDNFGLVLEELMKLYINKNKTKIEEICKSDKYRNKILQNTMKRINTTFYDGFEIKNGSNSFVTIESTGGHVTFDTGNAAITLIDDDLVNVLKLTKYNFFGISISGVTSSSQPARNIMRHYVIIELKLPKHIETIPNKIYTIKAFVKTTDIGSLSKQILLGQSALGLKLFFDDAYCIGYNDEKHKYFARMETNKEELNTIYTTIKDLPEININDIHEREIRQLHTVIPQLFSLSFITSKLISDDSCFTKLNELYTKFSYIITNKDKILTKLKEIHTSMSSRAGYQLYINMIDEILRLIIDL